MVKRHTKPRGPQSPGGIIEKEAPLHISNVHADVRASATSRRASARRGSRTARGVRVCRRCGEQLDKA